MDEFVKATVVVHVAPDVVFDVLADPATHAALDGTGRVRGPVDADRLTAPGQIFRMAMYHEGHPDGRYETANRVRDLERPATISWETGYDPGDGHLRFGGWSWRYDLSPAGPSSTRVTLTYDWSAVPDYVREYLRFPPFPAGHLDAALGHLAELVASRRPPRPSGAPPR